MRKALSEEHAARSGGGGGGGSGSSRGSRARVRKLPGRYSVGTEVWMPPSVAPGTWMNIGALVARSKFVCLHHSPCSPSCQPSAHGEVRRRRWGGGGGGDGGAARDKTQPMLAAQPRGPGFECTSSARSPQKLTTVLAVYLIRMGVVM